MAEKRDYYEVLGVSKDVDDDFRRSIIKVAKILSGYESGTNKLRRSSKKLRRHMLYLATRRRDVSIDQFGHAAFEGGAGGAGGYGGFDFNGADFSDIFGDIFGDLFGGSRRGGGRADQGPMKGVQASARAVRISFEEAGVWM